MTRDEAQTEIRRLAANRDNLRFTTHARGRSPEAGKYPISERQVAQCLQNGFLVGNPTPDIKLADGWKFTCRRAHEETVTEVAGVVVPERMILVITGYEDRPFRPKTNPRDGRDEEDED